MIQALRDSHALSVLTWQPIELDAVNAYFGTSLRWTDVTPHGVPAPLRAAIDRLPFPAATLKSSVLRRCAKRRVHAFDLVMSAHNEVDFGRPGIQYVHYPVRHVAPLPVDLRWYHRRWALGVYEHLWSLIAPFDDATMRANVTLVNSAWTGALVADVHGIAVQVVYPPAAGAFADVPWAKRENGFLCIGRISPEKRIEDVMAVVRAVRAKRPDAHLHIVGSDDHAAYARHVRRLARQAGPWVSIDGTLGIEALERLVTTHRYLLHGMREEHFGMSVAQALRAGCIPFVADGGGQVEVVGDEPLLRYRSLNDAAHKIETVMASAPLQAEIRARLAARASSFGPERFMEEIRRVVANTLSARATSRP
jgi:glycosyltransferase involved in cell wall biosynthesis